MALNKTIIKGLEYTYRRPFPHVLKMRHLQMNNNEFAEKIDELESSIGELQMENNVLEDSFVDAVQSYLDANELYEICLDEIKLLLDTCKKHGINIPEEEHCCGIIDKIRNWI